MFKNLLLQRKLVRESCAALEELCTSQPLQCERGNFAAGMQQENLPQPEQSFEITSKLFLPVCKAYPGDVQAALYVISSNLLRNGCFPCGIFLHKCVHTPQVEMGPHFFFPVTICTRFPAELSGNHPVQGHRYEGKAASKGKQWALEIRWPCCCSEVQVWYHMDQMSSLRFCGFIWWKITYIIYPLLGVPGLWLLPITHFLLFFSSYSWVFIKILPSIDVCVWGLKISLLINWPNHLISRIDAADNETRWICFQLYPAVP